ncbi:MAG: hypothetical protein FWB98_01830 [Defluviitaleaceae bacterium]|nr:hypothetical protein [Defluviitaleaceae bacterium]
MSTRIFIKKRGFAYGCKLKVIGMCVFFSKFDMQAVEALGYTTRTEAMRAISAKLGNANQYLKRRRDEFDVFMDNDRKGQRNRKPTRAVKDFHEELKDLAFEEFREKIKGIIDASEMRAVGRAVYPDDLPDNSVKYLEGKKKTVAVNTYERNPAARKLCIDYYGAACFICGFDFGKEYGEECEGFVHIHHLKMISETDGEYAINPINDLRPVCPNCHMVLHSKKEGCYTIEEVRSMLKRRMFDTHKASD